MKKIYIVLSSVILLTLSFEPVFSQNYLFDEPRKGGFKFIPEDRLDVTHAMHFSGSGMLARGFYNLYHSRGIKHARLWAGLSACGVGLLKEYEDSYREGWGRVDTFFNQLGILSFLLLKDQTQYSFTVEQVVSSAERFGVGVRFFKTKHFSPLQTSVGLFGYYDNYSEIWFGVDAHFSLIGRTELHTGMSLFKLQDPNRPNIQPTVGLAFRLH